VNAVRRRIAAEVFAAGRAADAQQANRLDRLRNVEPETAELLGVLVRAAAARRVLEVGTSNGYSTLWLADAVEAIGGRVETLDLDPRRTEQARVNLERTELDGLVDLRIAGAAQALTE
jgi:predicted O-methyltransferase YrrM